MNARTQAGGTPAGGALPPRGPRPGRWLAGLLLGLALGLPLATASSSSLSSPPERAIAASSAGSGETLMVTRAPGRLIERVVPEEGYRRVSDARPVRPPPAAAASPALALTPPVTAAQAEGLPPRHEPPQRDAPAAPPEIVVVVPTAAEAEVPLALAVPSAPVPEVPAAAPEAQADAPAPAAAELAQGAPLQSLQSSASARLEMETGLARVEPARGAPSESELVLGAAEATEPLLKLGPGDAITVSVFGRPEFNTTTYVSDDGRIRVPLAGAIAVAGLAPGEAAQRVADALREGQFLVNPQVSITLAQYRSQTVSVLGEVKAPGRYPIESRTSVFDLLAQAGGVLESGSDVVYLIRSDKDGKSQRHRVDLRTLSSDNPQLPRFNLRGGDSVFVPRAERFYVYGEVRSPNYYRLEAGMTVVQAIARGGGLTPRGSERRIEIKRRRADGTLQTLDAELNDAVRADDVIRVKERIF